MIQAIVCSFVAMSGAGMSSCGPITCMSSAVNRRVSALELAGDISRGSHRTPPFAPP